LLRQARFSSFDYQSQFEKALSGDLTALVSLIKFSLKADGDGAVDHGAVLIRLRSAVGSNKFNLALEQATLRGREQTIAYMNAANGIVHRLQKLSLHPKCGAHLRGTRMQISYGRLNATEIS
jgi:hypothetical protein